MNHNDDPFINGVLTTPFYLNMYVAHGVVISSGNPMATREASINAVSGNGINSRVRVTRMKGFPDRSAFDWNPRTA